MIDATEGVTEQDAKIAGIAHERGKGIIIAVNKWDAIEKDNNTVKQHTEKIRQILSFIPYAEILFISAKSGQRLNKIFELIDVVIENNSMRVATGVLNEIVTEAVAMQQPPTDKGKRLKIYYVTQVSVKPPTLDVYKRQAIEYVPGEAAPKILATGKGVIADKIIERAKESNVPTYKDDKLADTLSRLKIGDMIPTELYEVVAEILVFVNDLDKLKAKIDQR